MSFGGFLASGSSGGDARLLVDSSYPNNSMAISAIPHHHLLTPPISQPASTLLPSPLPLYALSFPLSLPPSISLTRTHTWL